MRDRNYIQSLERGLKILEIFGEYSRPLSLTEIAQHTGLNKTTTQRFLHTLYSLGYLKRDENKEYFCGPRVLSLGVSYVNNSNLVKIAKPYLDEMSSSLQKTVNMAVLDRSDIIFLYRREVRRFLKFDLYPGARLPSHCTAQGKMLLAGLDDDTLGERISEMELTQLTPLTITSKELLWKEIMKTRKRGHSISDRELTMDLITLGVPLVDGRGKVVAAINIALEAKDSERSSIRDMVSRLKEEGEAISRAIGYRGRYPAFDV